MWGPLTNPSQDLTKWEKHPIETLHAELCKNILHVPRHTTNNACRAELGKYPLITKIQKRPIKFWKHLKLSDPQSYHYKALQYQEMSKESKPFLQLIQSFSPDASLMALFHCMVRHGTVHFWGVFHWVLYLVPDTFLVPLRSRFHANRTVTKT